jgi:hypothetical protein
MGLAILCVAAALVFLALAGRYNEAVAARSWDEALAPQPAEIFGRVKDSIEAQTLMVEMSYRSATQRHDAGFPEEAALLLRLGARTLDACSPSLIQLVRGTRSLARHAQALGPVPALSRSPFRTTGMRGLALLHRGLHHLALTLRARLVLRVSALGSGVRIVCRLLSLSTERALEDLEDARWSRMEALGADLGVLGRETLVTLRIVLASLRDAAPLAPHPEASRTP